MQVAEGVQAATGGSAAKIDDRSIAGRGAGGVGIASVTQTIAVGVDLIGIGDQTAVISVIRHRVAVGIIRIDRRHGNHGGRIRH